MVAGECKKAKLARILGGALGNGNRVRHVMRVVAKAYEDNPEKIRRFFNDENELVAGVATSAYHCLTGDIRPIQKKEYGGLGAVIVDSESGLAFERDQLRYAKLSGHALPGSEISGRALRYAKISEGAMLSAKISGEAMWNAKISGEALRYAKISEGAMLVTKISGEALRYAKISGEAMWNAKISGGAMWEAKISEGAMLGAKISGKAMWEAKISREVLDHVNISGEAKRGIIEKF